MKLALAQIDMRLGDIEGICSRIADQAALAADAGAQLLCVPAPLFTGVQPTTLIEYADFEHDLIRSLRELAAKVEERGVACLVPAVVSVEQVPLAEAFLLREGRVIPLRTLMGLRDDRVEASMWEPVVFELAGTRIAVTFDFARDIAQLPRGCDLMIYFQTTGFDISNEETCAVASVADGHYADDVAHAGIWLASMVPVGSFDETVYTGGSFVMDDGGRVMAAAPCFEEGMVVQEVRRGEMGESLDTQRLPRFQREEWLWEALRIFVRDTVAARGFTRVVVPLEGDLPTSLLAALAVDALGPRNVVGMGFGRSDVFTPQQETRERERVERVRALAATLNIQLVEREHEDVSRWMDRDVPARDVGRLRLGINALYLADIAHELDACVLSSITKTDAALAPASLLAASTPRTVCAPFGDIYLTALEFLARYRNRISPVLSVSTVSLSAVEDHMVRIVSEIVSTFDDDPSRAARVAATLAALEPAQIDDALEAHVDRNCSFDDQPLAHQSPDALALLLLVVRQGEGYRRSLPLAPIVSARAFAERIWPPSLAWSDLGRRGAAPERVVDVAREEMGRLETRGAERGLRVRGEILGLLGDLLGLTPEQRAELASEEGQQRMRENAERFENQLREALLHLSEHDDVPDGGRQTPGMPPHHYPFFSQN
ncbi:nitrilase-related carbon-nitrogen hydrolase [Collinsella tanakaei]|uniref:nitrilase-related carbon-nitrogen hydrolase n=1 Tax=Collinsella tanakaei TaxID=626935 RepID=UPI001F2FCBDC|nr:nitrilase-related carbon-nitrogen hydrolase [Collinsella tanakaei]MCF2621227.1 hypothetical protein [Collinsella tanakaei]